MRLILVIILSSVFLVNCQTKTKSSTQDSKQVVLSPSDIPSDEDASEAAPSHTSNNQTDGAISMTVPVKKKIGLILGPGGMKTYAYINVLREFDKNKVEISAISGIEFGALAAALYAQKGSANDVEWQMYKLKEEDLIKKNLFGKPEMLLDLRSQTSKYKSFFTVNQIESFKVPFACPSLSLKQAKTYIFGKGEVTNTLLRCIAYPPFYLPYDNYIASVNYVKEIADSMRSSGINHVIYVNLLDAGSTGIDLDPTSVALWSQNLELIKRINGVDRIINLYNSNYGITSIGKRRELQTKAQQEASLQVKKLVNELNL